MTVLKATLGVSKGRIPYFSAWLGVWSILPEALASLHAGLQTLDLNAHLASLSADALEPDRDVEIRDGIALVSINGPMTKHYSSYGGSCSTVDLRKTIRSLAADDGVRGIMLVAETPGGTTAGTHELANDIAAAAQRKPVWGFCSDLCASAGYWALCRTSRIIANAPARVGSIGTYGYVVDSSAAFADAGLKAYVVNAGEFKGSFEPGTEITESQLSQLRSEIIAVNQFFLSAVKAGRGMDDVQVAAIADGRVHLASDALKLGLIDAVMSFDEAFDSFVASIEGRSTDDSTPADGDSPPAPSEEPESMADSKPATLAELNARFPHASSTWKRSCIERCLTVEEAAASYTDQLQARIEELESRKGPGVKANAAGGKKKKGARSAEPTEDEEVEPDPELEEDDPDMEDEDPLESKEEQECAEEEEVISRYREKFSKALSHCGGDRVKAVAYMTRNYGKLHARYVEMNNRRSMRGRARIAAANRAAQDARSNNARRR